MTTLRGTLKKVMSKIEGINPNMIIGPNDVIKDDYDLLIVDKSHRLYRRVGITGYGSYDTVNRTLNFDKEATQLDWITKCSKHQIFFYDRLQSVRPSDIREEDFLKLKSLPNFGKYDIKSQLRVQGGNDYLKYIKEIFSENPPKEKIIFENYEFKLYSSIHDMKKDIIERDSEVGLSRLVAGYAWEWTTKGFTYQEAIKNNICDLIIENERFIWNTTNSGWVISDNAINEVGSIHTIQGYDLNYAGVIIGRDIYYDLNTKSIEIKKENYFDKKGKVSLESYNELKKYIINIYIVLLSRAIKGTYVYICDDNLRNYIKNYI